MTLWFVFALMTAAAIFAVLWPLGHARPAAKRGSEAAVYKDQLAEIDRDRAAGLIGAPEADAARVEISRRLLAAADHQRAPPTASNVKLRRIAAASPWSACRSSRWRSTCRWARRALATFRWPSAPARPTPTSRSTPWWRRSRRIWRKTRPMAAAGTCWRRCWCGSGRYDDAVRAFRNSITYNGDSADRRADLGEALDRCRGRRRHRGGQGGIRTRRRDRADEVKARYFLGLAAEQDGRNAEAARSGARCWQRRRRCAMASAGSGRVGPDRWFGGAAAARRYDSRGQGHE